MKTHISSRRTALLALVGAAVKSGGLLKAASLRNRALVSIRLSEGTDADGMLDTRIARGSLSIVSSISQERFGLHESLSGVRNLFEQKAVAIVQDDVSSSYDRDFLRGGFAAPGWMMRAAGANVMAAPGRAYSFRTGAVMLTPRGVNLDGGALDNPTLMAVTDRSGVIFPNTAIGHQMRQIAGLLASSGDAQVMFSATLGGTVMVGGAEQQRAARLRQLDEALTAFHEAMLRMGVAQDVTTFTDADVVAGSRGMRPRLVMGGAVMGGEVYSLTNGTQEAGVALAEWAGYRSGNLFRDAVRMPTRFLI